MTLHQFQALPLLFLISNWNGGLSLRTCTDVQNTLLACVMSSDIDQYVIPGREDVTQLCWHADVLLECVEEAKGTCPNIPILSDPDFSSAIREVSTVWNRYCHQPEPLTQTTPTNPMTSSELMPSDQGEPCNPVAALTSCNDYMIGVEPGDVRAMCGSGEDYLECLMDIVETCPEHSSVLNFDLDDAIHSTRHMLQYECDPEKAALYACGELIEAAEVGCAYYLSDGSTTDYCRSKMRGGRSVSAHVADFFIKTH